MAKSTCGNVNFVHTKMSDNYYTMIFKDEFETKIRFESNIENPEFIIGLLFTGTIKQIYTGPSLAVPGQKLMIRSFGDEDERKVEVVIKDDMFGELFHRTFAIDEEAIAKGEAFLNKLKQN